MPGMNLVVVVVVVSAGVDDSTFNGDFFSFVN